VPSWCRLAEKGEEEEGKWGVMERERDGRALALVET